MRAVFMGLSGVVLGALAIIGNAEVALQLGMAMAVAEIFSLCAAEMYYISAALELDDRQRRRLGSTAMLMALASLIGLTGLWALGCIPGKMIAVGAAYAVLRVQLERARLNCNRAMAGIVGALGILVMALPEAAMRLPFEQSIFLPAGAGIAVLAAEIGILATAQPGARGLAKPTAQVFRALPEALLSRTAYILPAVALCLAAWRVWSVNTVLAYAAGLAAFGVLRVDGELRGAAQERFGVRWLPGGLLAAICVLLGWNGVFSAVYCVWGVIAALLPVRHGAAVWGCALLAVLQAVCGVLGGYGLLPVGAAAGIVLALVVLMALLQRGAIYAAWLPVRARRIRRRAAK